MSPEGPWPSTGSWPSAVLSDRSTCARCVTKRVPFSWIRVTSPKRSSSCACDWYIAGRRRQNDGGAAVHGHFRPGPFQRHQIIPVGHLPADCRRHDIRSVVPVDPGIARIDHPQLARLAQVDRGKAEPHTVQERGEPRPAGNQQQAASPRPPATRASRTRRAGCERSSMSGDRSRADSGYGLAAAPRRQTPSVRLQHLQLASGIAPALMQRPPAGSRACAESRSVVCLPRRRTAR